MQFRHDINGLRAWAVIAVVLFHFNNNWLSGGFAGVDVFFVISGYLMTAIILSRIGASQFNLIQFYVNRANRIIPALAVLCLFVGIFGWFNLSPPEYKELGKSLVTSMSFVSNLQYLKGTGYFDSLENEKWLLHTWSLSTEWQFYILYPIGILILSKLLSLKKLKLVLLIATIIGFILSIVITKLSPNFAYFMLPARAWEMLLGGLAFVYPLSQIKNILMKRSIELIGLGLIVSSYLFFDKSTPWPSYFAALAVVGTYLIIISNRQNSIFTNNVFFQHIGQWSYSIYLWHWPIVVLGHYYHIQDWWVVGIPLSLLMGYLSYEFIESIRLKKYDKFKDIFSIKPIYMFLAIAGLGSFIFISNGAMKLRYSHDDIVAWKNISQGIVMPNRLNDYCFTAFDLDKKLTVCDRKSLNCHLGFASKNSETLLFGDSFAGHNEPFWDLFFNELKMSYQSVSTSWCFPSLNDDFYGPKTHKAYQQCLLNREFLRETIENKKIKNLIIAGLWKDISDKGYMANVYQLIQQASENNINVIIMPMPKKYQKKGISQFQQYVLSGRHEENFNIEQYFLDDGRQTHNDIKKNIAQYSNVFFVEQENLFDKSGMFKHENNYLPYTLEGYHISLIGSKNAYQYFRKTQQYAEIKNILTD